jgi:2-dehydropantoate 2-reductase
MKLLVLGAGGTGGYFGGLLAKVGADVTFLVRPKRRDQLARAGIRIESASGSVAVPVKTITRDEISDDYDVVVVSAKAYDLDDAIEAIRPAVGEATLVLPLLNGMKHLAALDAAFGAQRVLGGTCHISVTLTDDGTIRKLGDLASITQGPRQPGQAARSKALHETLARAFDSHYAANIIAAMWEKWFFLAAFAASTCLMRAPVGDIVRSPGGDKFMIDVLAECASVATANGYLPASLDFARTFLTDPESKLSASMARDIARGGRIEANQIVGDMIRRGKERGIATPLLDVAYLNLLAYQQQHGG